MLISDICQELIQYEVSSQKICVMVCETETLCRVDNSCARWNINRMLQPFIKCWCGENDVVILATTRSK